MPVLIVNMPTKPNYVSTGLIIAIVVLSLKAVTVLTSRQVNLKRGVANHFITAKKGE